MNKPVQTSNPLFDIFWAKYPRKEGKPKALRTFEKLKVTEDILADILAELERQARIKDWKHINVKYIPLAQTWLNRKDWEENQNGNDKHTDTKNAHSGCCTVL